MRGGASNTASRTNFTMRTTIVYLLLLTEVQRFLTDATNQEKKNPGKSEDVLVRAKRRWVLSTFELDENSDGPFPQVFTELHNDQHLSTSHKFRISGQGVSKEPKNVFTINEKTGVIYLHKPIDRELYPVLKVQFDVLDDENNLLDKTLAFDVIIRDKNDNPPVFTPDILNVKIPENIKEGLLPFSLHASDEDELENDNSRISLRIVSQNPPLPEVYIQSSSEVQNTVTATFAFTGCFDYDKLKIYKILVEALDHGTPPQSSTATVNLIITDSNTHAPVLLSKEQIAEVMEMETNKEILRIPVEDLDTPNTPGSKAVFTILKGNEKGNYKIGTDPVTNEGVLTVIKAKDYEAKVVNELEIGVQNEEELFMCVDGKPVNPVLKDSRANNTAKINIKVIDVNDPPVFKNKIQRVFKVEEEDPGEVLYTPTVTDEDTHPSKIRYELAEDPANWMSIDPKTGQISLVKKMDRESPHVRNNTYNVVMRAIDDGEPPATGTGTLAISLIDKNDNTPRLSPNASVMCGNKADQVKMSAEDADVFPFSGPFAFKFGAEDEELLSLWHIKTNINSETFLVCRKTLPYGKYTVPLKIVDLQGGVGYDVLQVVVCDCGEGDECLKPLPRTSKLHGAGVGVLLGAFLLMAVLLCCVFFCEKGKMFTEYKEEENQQGLMVYHEEGRGSLCEKDWEALTKPKHLETKSKPKLNQMMYLNNSTRDTIKLETNSKAKLNQKMYLNNSTADTIKPGTNFQPECNIHLNKLTNDTYKDTKIPYGFGDVIDSCSRYRLYGDRERHGSNTKHGTIWTGLSRSLNTEILERVYCVGLNEAEEIPHDYASEGTNCSMFSVAPQDLDVSDEDLDFLTDLGPKFNTLAEICQRSLQKKDIKL